MGYIEKKSHLAKDGKRTTSYRARYRAPDGALQSKTFTRKIDAERHLLLMEAGKLRGEYVDPQQARTLFSEVAETWRAAQVHRGSTAAAVECDLRLHILSAFGTRPIGAMRPSEIQAWVKRLSEKLAPAGVIRAYRWTAAVFRMAVADGLIARSPCTGIKLPTKAERKVVPLRVEEVEALLDSVSERYRALVMVGAGAGLRISEAIGLTLPQVDFLRRAIRVEQQLVVLPGRPPHQADVKGPASRRVIPAGDVVLQALARHLERFPATTEVTGFVSRVPEPLVFTTSQGRAISRTEIGKRLRPWFRAAGLPDTVSYHDLRHFYASLLISRGASVKVVQEHLGHASAAETLNTYSHLWADDDARSRTAVDEALSGALAPHTRPTTASS